MYSNERESVEARLSTTGAAVRAASYSGTRTATWAATKGESQIEVRLKMPRRILTSFRSKYTSEKIAVVAI
jgi:hypothetical protein